MKDVKMIIANKSLKIIDQIVAVRMCSKFKVLDLIDDENRVISQIKKLKPDIVFLGDDFENLKVFDVLDEINKDYLNTKTVFVIISRKKIPSIMKMYKKYNVMDVLYTALDDEELRETIYHGYDRYKKQHEKQIQEDYFLNEYKKRYEYKYDRYIDYREYFTNEDFEKLEKLDVYIDPLVKYTEEENDVFRNLLLLYEIDEENLSIPVLKHVEFAGVSYEDFERLNDIFWNMDLLYKEQNPYYGLTSLE